jgi:hypothetical protein
VEELPTLGQNWIAKVLGRARERECGSWFNHHRLLKPIGYIPPAEAEVNYYQQLAEKAVEV